MSKAPMKLKVNLGPMPADEPSGVVVDGLRQLFDRGELCDVSFVVAGQTFMAHRAVLAAASHGFSEPLAELSNADMNSTTNELRKELPELQLEGINNPEAVRAMLDYIYGPRQGATRDYKPSSEDANSDVLRLAQRFQLPQLQDDAARWLVHGLSTGNVIGRLAACEEFGLTEVRARILEQLTANPEVLYTLVQNPEIRSVPAVLQDLLVQILTLLGCGKEGEKQPKENNGNNERRNSNSGRQPGQGKAPRKI
eukprot:CAMPEP_0172682402 /NCGR_PEP_ID=MMETSP1074-20121228/18138_1 /TAXON_ID=2916 /ORGANISM="Ceratium fusus, Strain PA161109" /LENGTH=252 /DNA_ID=CAMNT_0013501083 /DNA_START=37 /DNA_END=795 /DNA_ORIENTATION=-